MKPTVGWRRGNTLLEVVFATAVFALMLVAVASLIPIVMRADRRAHNIDVATQLAQGMIEVARAAPFPTLTNSYTDWNQTTNPGIATYLSNNSPFQQYPSVSVGGTVYTCSLQIAALTYHPDNNTPNNPADETPRLKQITATVAWDTTVPPVVVTEAAYDTLPQ